MRDSNHRSISNNKPVITITSTVYDRRALDIESTVPLINSLNHLTYLTSNSAKIRETIANDGALDRLVSILHNCHLSLHEILDKDLEFFKTHERAKSIYKRKRLALCAWKWTLAFQCLVLTGTRGTEQIRKKVVLAGVIPVLATVLDNYMLFHNHYDFIRDETLDFEIDEILTFDSYKLLRKNSEETYEEYISYLIGRDKLKPTDFKRFSVEELTTPIMTCATDFRDVWQRYNDSPLPTSSDKSNAKLEENCFYENDEEKFLVSTPRSFFIGKIIPKQDDVIWSLQLLAFISKYTYMKQKLQNVELIDSLSFRSMIERYKKRKMTTFSNNLSPLSISKNLSEKDENIVGDIKDESDITNLQMKINNPIIKEIMECGKRCLKIEKKRKECKPKCRTCILNMKSPPYIKNLQLNKYFDRLWNYQKVSKRLTDETWNSFISKQLINAFPLVEKYTITDKNTHDIIYWSSVIMRNSCRKNEVTGVRQCANFSCGKWERYPREFAKCRRCKRTKYCSRECQLEAWKHHRYWCHEVTSSNKSSSMNTETNTPGGTGNDSSTMMARTEGGTILPTNTAGLMLQQHTPDLTHTEEMAGQFSNDNEDINGME
ncbi:MYND finger [Nakaseomyces glabratus]|nr:MYND finger [Nakaseomyces glabratus]KAH7584470.1 MYND finger [Nakaseomyces glabratus]